MIDLGVVIPGKTIFLPWNTFNSAGASVTLSGLATSDIKIYKDGSTTERASTSGYTLLDTDGIDFDGITGIHGISISLADNTTAGFYTAGSHYVVVISTVTIDGQTVSFVGATFRIGYPTARIDTTIATLSSQIQFTLTSGPAEDDALNGMELLIHDAASATQVSSVVVNDYTGSTRTVLLSTAAQPTFTIAAGDNVSVMARAPLQPVVQGRQLAVTSAGSTTVGLFENDCITEAAIADNAITSGQLATSAITEIQSGLATSSSITSLDTKIDGIPVAVRDVNNDNPAESSFGASARAATELPGATDIATAVRLALATELARIDAAITTRAAPGDEMDLINAPNATAVTAIQDGLALASGVTVSDKTGFKLASDGLDSVSATEPTGVASTFPQRLLQVWCRFFRPAVHDTAAETLKTYASDGTTLRTTQSLTVVGDTETQGNAT